MAINFPDSPSVNDTHTVNGRTWVWDGNAWKLSGTINNGISLEISDTPPATPIEGDMWYDSSSGSTFTYYQSTWVELGNTAAVTAFIADNDGDTYVHVEESTDEDTVRVYTGGTERVSIGASAMIPAGNEAYDLGSTTNRFRDLYLSGSSIDLGGVSITSDGTNLALPPISSVSGDFTVDTDTLHVDSTNNRVGIGTASPASTLDIHGASFAEINLNDSNGTVGASTNSKVQFQAGGVDAGLVGFNTASGIMTLSQENGPLWINNKSANNIVFRTSDNTQMTLDSSGNLGIGTPTPSYELHVAAYNPTLLLEATASNSNMPAIRFEGTKVTTGTASEVALNSRNTGSFTINIDPNDSDADNASYFSVDIDGSEALRIDSSGNVGIGKQSPSELLDIDAGTSGSVSLTTSGGRTIQLTANDSDPFLSVGSTTAHSAAIMTNGVRRIIVLDDGKVGIGRTSPSYLLDVNGDAQIAHTGQADLFVKTTANSSYGASITIGGARTASSTDNLSQLKFYNFANQSTGGDYEAARISAVDPSANYANGRGALVFKTSNGGSLTEQMRLDENGVLILSGGTTSTSVPSAVTSAGDSGGLFFYGKTNAGSGRMGMWIDGDGGAGDLPFVIADNNSTINCVIYGDGDLANRNNSYGVYSDVSLKQDIVKASSQWDDIKAVQLRKYRLISKVEELGDDAPVYLGVVAQELEAAGMSGLVETREKDIKTVKSSVLYMKAVGALQEAMERIEALETQNTDLVARIEALEAN